MASWPTRCANKQHEISRRARCTSPVSLPLPVFPPAKRRRPPASAPLVSSAPRAIRNDRLTLRPQNNTRTESSRASWRLARRPLFFGFKTTPLTSFPSRLQALFAGNCPVCGLTSKAGPALLSWVSLVRFCQPLDHVALHRARTWFKDEDRQGRRKEGPDWQKRCHISWCLTKLSLHMYIYIYIYMYTDTCLSCDAPTANLQSTRQPQLVVQTGGLMCFRPVKVTWTLSASTKHTVARTIYQAKLSDGFGVRDMEKSHRQRRKGHPCH